MLRSLKIDNPEGRYYYQMNVAEEFIGRDIDEFSKSQPPSVFPVAGLNSAPSGPAPSQSGVSSSGARSKKAAKNKEGPSRISGVEESAPMPGGQPKAATRPSRASSSRGPTGASLKPLVRETKNKLPLPYYDTENDSYIFNHGKINNILN